MRITNTNLVKTQMTKKEVRLLAHASLLHFNDRMDLFVERGGSIDDIEPEADVIELYTDALEIPNKLIGIFAAEFINAQENFMSIEEFLEALPKRKKYNHIMTKALKKFLRRNQRLIDENTTQITEKHHLSVQPPKLL